MDKFLLEDPDLFNEIIRIYKENLERELIKLIEKRITEGKFSQYNYDVIVTNNIYKNSCDGPEVLRELREIYDFTTPIVVLTVSTGQEDKFINRIGFDGYLEKMLTQKQAEVVMT